MSGPLPQWEMAGQGGPYEIPAPDGTVWRLWHDDEFPMGDGWRLAPRDAPGEAQQIDGGGGLYAVLAIAEERIGLHDS